MVQGNIRRGTAEVLQHLRAHFDLVILSTWSDEAADKIPVGDWVLVLSDKPVVAGGSHRNYQRLNTAAGLRRAAELGASHVLKWRTDMLPTKLDVAQLLAWSQFAPPTGLPGRVVTCAFRNLTVKQDWFSTIPDLFAFAPLALMQLLWGDECFDYGLELHLPPGLVRDCGTAWMERPDVLGLYCAEAELYALFRQRLQTQLQRTLQHRDIAKQCMRLVDHRWFGICWFGDAGFRPITQALQHPWWTEAQWRSGEPIRAEWGYPDRGWKKKFSGKYLTRWVQKTELRMQQTWYEDHLAAQLAAPRVQQRS